MSSTKKNLRLFKFFSAQSLNSSVTSIALKMETLDNVGIQVNITSGTPSGTFSIQCSIDYIGNNPPTTGNWIPVTGMSQVVTAGSPSNIYFDISQLSAPHIQLVWTSGSGTGTCDAFFTGKMI